MPDAYDHAGILDRLRARIPLAGQNATSLARALKLSDDAVNVWFSRGRFPLEHAPAAASLLGVSPAWLLFGEDSTPVESVLELARQVALLAERQEALAAGFATLADAQERLVQSLERRLAEEQPREERA